jgi:3-methyladenine DNA glycosylase AlkD
MTYQEIHNFLLQSASCDPKRHSQFYKTGPGQYASHDQFLGISSATIHACAKKFETIGDSDLQMLIESSFNEERALALDISIRRYRRGNDAEKEQIFRWYLDHLHRVNNWNLVDASAHYIVGAHLYGKEKDLLFELACSDILWERRIAVVATWYDIRHDRVATTLKISEVLIQDDHDLIHKAVGWMLREVGKKNIGSLCTFLDDHSSAMPRTMLRYAIEKFPKSEREKYLLKGKLPRTGS